MSSGRAEAAAGALWVHAARSLHQHETEAQTLSETVLLARTVIRGSDHAGITRLDGDGKLESPACTDPLVRELDELQAALGEGPSLEALTGPRLLLIEDMESERRWPQFAPQARRLGINGMLACRLGGEHGPRAALNLHTRRPGAFDSTTAQTAAIYAEYAAVALTRAALVESLRSAMVSRQTIGEATGILMERRRLDSPSAFALLVCASQRLNVKLRRIAEHLVRTGQNPEDLAAADFPPPARCP